MARKGIINRIVDGINSNMNSLYRQTYYSNITNKQDLEDLRANMSKSIESINNGNLDNIGMPTISKLYTKLMDVQKDKGTINTIESVLEDKTIMDSLASTYMRNRYIREQDKEVDVICKYMPKLVEALDTKKDNVLSADHFDKEFINVENRDSLDNFDPDGFDRRIQELKEKYMIEDIVEETYDKIAKYGEVFYYVVPYKKAINKLLKNKGNTTVLSRSNVNFTENGLVTESGELAFEYKEQIPKDINLKDIKLNIELNNSFLIDEYVKDAKFVHEKYDSIRNESVVLESLEDENNNIGRKRYRSFDKTIDDDLTFDGFDDTSNEGLINQKEEKSQLKEIPGCILKDIPRHHVTPVYIDNMCLGYYYYEFEDSEDFDMLQQTDPLLTIKTSQKVEQQEAQKQDSMLRFLSSQISQYIDAKFINANYDLSKEIYLILKHNDLYNSAESHKIRVTFIPPEDMFHLYFKKDPETHRGISDLIKSLLPAKLYVCLYITNAIAQMTRGQDKRVYYVKQNVDTNIAKTLLNTINQIKKSNFGIRQIENINNILNITGRFNDYVIPMGPTGEAPVQFEVMQGQQIEPPTELMNALEEMAVNATDVPLEVVQARQQMDYAVHYTMTNSRFLKRVNKRQSICELQRMYSGLISRIYSLEYGENVKLKLRLPPPMFLNVTNTSQMITNAIEYGNNIASVMVPDEEDEIIKAKVTKHIQMNFLRSFIDVDTINEVIRRAKQEAAADQVEKPNEEQ